MNDRSVGHRMSFAAAPGVLPATVQRKLIEHMECHPEVGLPLLHISHRSEWFKALVVDVERRMKRMLAIPQDYRVLFLQGGATLQFSLAPMNLGATAVDMIVAGYWSRRAVAEMTPVCGVTQRWSGDGRTLPEPAEVAGQGTGTLFYISNETVEGMQFDYIPDYEGDIICDMSSDILSRPVEFSRYAIAYAHAQKQLGPPGLTVVVVRPDVIERSRHVGLPPMMTYAAHADKNSIYNTPPCFQIYLQSLLFDWMEHEIGGVTAMQRRNREKAGRIFETIRRYETLYRVQIPQRWQSETNVAFHLPDVELERRFLREADEMGFYGLAGHRSVGGCRISLYNTVEPEHVELLAGWMEDFAGRA